MPITACFSCFGLLGALLLVLVAPASVVLLLGGEKRAALRVLRVPVGMIGLSILLTLLVFAAAERHSRIMSGHPDALFGTTFGFPPPPGTLVLNGYCDMGMDFALTVLKFRTTTDIIDRIITSKFIPSDRRTCLWSHENGYSNMPAHVLSWFLPPQASSICWYSAEGFDDTFGHDEAILGYDEDTHVVYFYWCGVD